jgi:hypothetical protein
MGVVVYTDGWCGKKSLPYVLEVIVPSTYAAVKPIQLPAEIVHMRHKSFNLEDSGIEFLPKCAEELVDLISVVLTLT